MSTNDLTQRYATLAATRRIEVGVNCLGHRFVDVPVDPAKRLRTGEVQCWVCTLIVPAFAAWLYEQGVRHGEEAERRRAVKAEEA